MSQDNNNSNFNIKEENIEKTESDIKQEVEKEFNPQSSSTQSQNNFITLNAKICHETSCGMLVISVNYNNKSFIGTLLDTSKYSYSVPIPENQLSYSNSKNSNLQNSKQISNLNDIDNECKSAFSDGRGSRKLKGRNLRSTNNSTSPSNFSLSDRKTRRSLLANEEKCKKGKSNDSDNSENCEVVTTKSENLPGNKGFNNGKRKYKIKGNLDGDESKTSDCEKVNSPKQKERKYKRTSNISKTPKKQLTKPEKSKKKINSNHNSSDEESKKVKKKTKGRPSSRQATKKNITYYQNSDEFGDDEVASHFNTVDESNFVNNKESKKNSRGSRRNSYSVLGVKIKNVEKVKSEKKSRPMSTISGQKRKGMNKINNISKKLLTDPTPDNTSIHESVPGSPKQDSPNFQITVHNSEPRLEQNNVNINANYLNASVINRGISPYSDISENEPLIMQSIDQKSDVHSQCLEKRDYDLLNVSSPIDGINTKAQFKPDHSIFEQKPLDIKPSIPPPPKLISRQVLGTNFASNVAVPMPIKPDMYNGNKNKRIFISQSNGNGKVDKRE